jgi:sec-independent protein translocase protein TatA
MKPGMWEILIILVIVVLIFGVGKIADAGPALGKAISGFKKAVKDTDEPEASKAVEVDNAEPPA